MPGRDDYFNVPLRHVAVGGSDELRQPAALRAALAELISTLIFVFAGSGSTMAYNKITDSAPAAPAGIIAAAIAYGFALFVAVASSANISSGHVNPTITFGLFVCGNITLFRRLLYIC